MVDRKERKRSIIQSIYLLDSILFYLKKKQVDIYSRYQKKIVVTLCTFRFTCMYPIIMPDNADKNIKVKEIERKRQTEIVPIT